MKRIRFVVIFLVCGLLSASCGAIPTLPSLDSTVTIMTPYFTDIPGLPFETEQVQGQESTETPPESPAAPPETVEVVVKPTETPFSPTATPLPAITEAPTSQAPTPTFTPLVYPYAPQVMNPHYLVNFSRPELGCDWLGVGGQVFSKEGVVQKDILIKAGGDLNGSPVLEEMTMPLADPDVDVAYGPGGYELTLANAPADSEGTLWIQLFSLGGDPLSAQIYLDTFDDCQKNLLLMNFIEN